VHYSIIPVLEIENSPLLDHDFGIVFPRTPVGLICLRDSFFYRKLKSYLIVRGARLLLLGAIFLLI